MKVKVMSESGHEYEVDTEELTCTCPHWRYRCHNYSTTHPNRICKHLDKVFIDNPELAPMAYRINDPSSVAVESSDGKVRYPRIIFEPYVTLINNSISAFSNLIKKHYVCGSYRRMKDMISDLDVLLVTTEDMVFPDEFFDYFEVMPGYKVDKLWRGARVTGKKASYKINDLVQVDFMLVPEESLPFALCHFTGSKEENIELRRVAGTKHHSLSQYGLRNDEDGKTYIYGIKTEEDLYKWLGLPYKQPWQR